MAMENKRKTLIVAVIAVLAIMVAVIIGVVIYNNSAPVRLNKQLELGQKYLEEQNYEQAVLEYNIAIEIDPMNVSAYLGKAEAYLGMGDYENAIIALKEAMNFVPDTEVILSKLEEIYLNYAENFIIKKEYEKGIEILKEALENFPDSETIIAKLETTYIKQADKLLATSLEKEAIILLEDGYQLIQSESIREKIIKIIEEHVDSLESGKVFDNIESMYIDYAWNLHLTDEEIEEICVPVIYILEKYMEYFPDSLEYYEELSYLYYMVKDFQKCKTVMEQGHELSGGELFAEVYSGENDGNLYNEYGKIIYQNEYSFWTEYGTDGRVISEGGTDIYGIDYEMNYERGSDGRIAQVTGKTPDWLEGGKLCAYTLIYTYPEPGKCWIKRTEEGRECLNTEITFNEYGLPIKEHVYHTDSGYEMIYYYEGEYKEEMYLNGELIYSYSE